MSDTTESESEGPKQTISRMPAEDDIGPHFPSGMNTVEAAISGATEGMTEEAVASLKGEAAPAAEPAAEE